jgi:hypothetical protein
MHAASRRVVLGVDAGERADQTAGKSLSAYQS